MTNLDGKKLLQVFPEMGGNLVRFQARSVKTMENYVKLWKLWKKAGGNGKNP